MRYRHIRTGVVIDVDSVLSGCWEPEETPSKPEKATATKPVKNTKQAKETKK